MIIKVKKLVSNAVIPEYKTEGAAGMDLYSIKDDILKPGEIKAIGTGIILEIPKEFEGQVRPRSGLSLKGITVANAPGTIDSDYRGEVKVILINLGTKEFNIEAGSRIAQLVIQRTMKCELTEDSELSSTERGSDGFGSTGL